MKVDVSNTTRLQDILAIKFRNSIVKGQLDPVCMQKTRLGTLVFCMANSDVDVLEMEWLKKVLSLH